jgi:hypothetical protein
LLVILATSQGDALAMAGEAPGLGRYLWHTDGAPQLQALGEILTGGDHHPAQGEKDGKDAAPTPRPAATPAAPSVPPTARDLDARWTDADRYQHASRRWR